MKKGKVIRNIVLIIVALIIIAGIGTVIIFNREIQIISSIEKFSGEHPYYVMDYKNGYHLEELLQKNISSDGELADILAGYISHGFYTPSVEPEIHIGCSTLTCMNEEGNMLWGRNFDWYDSVPIIVRATPNGGYASISTCEFSNITGDATSLPEGIANSFLAIAAYWVPMDGINEKGLCVANLEVNEGGQKLIDTSKNNITVTMATRLLLDKAANIDEAVQLLEQYDICPSGGISSHLSISDSTGKAVVVEFMDGKIEVVETQVVTNFNLKNGDITAGGESAMNRYNTLVDIYEDTNGIMQKENIVKSMEAASQKEGKWMTRWTIVYENTGMDDLDNLAVNYYWSGDYENVYQISLK
ncbi:MAG: linear amide C-N hydrolase [Lachnospiraceae bacterium]